MLFALESYHGCSKGSGHGGLNSEWLGRKCRTIYQRLPNSTKAAKAKLVELGATPGDVIRGNGRKVIFSSQKAADGMRFKLKSISDATGSQIKCLGCAE